MPIPESQEQQHESLALARVYCWLIAVLHPGWAIALGTFLPDEYNDLLGRSLFGALFLVAGIGSYLSGAVRRALPTINFIGYNIVALHWCWLVHRSGLAPIYVTGSLVIAFAFNLGFIHPRQLVLYSTVFVSGIVAVAVLTEAPMTSKFMLVMGVVTSQVVGIFFVFMRSKIARNLRAVTLRALVLQQELTQKELDAAQVVQRHLLAAPLSLPHVGFDSFYCSANTTGGDWFGHHVHERSQILSFWVGDVTGHGFPSALITGVACGAVYAGEKYAHTQSSVDPEARIALSARIVNEVLFERSGSLSMTMLFVCLDVSSGALYVGNAGHQFPYVIGQDGQAKPLLVKGNILGLDRECKLQIKKYVLRPGDTVFLYTDGLLENRGPQAGSLSHSGLKRLLESASSPSKLVEHVMGKARSIWADRPLDDDVTIVRVTWMPQGDPDSGVALRS